MANSECGPAYSGQRPSSHDLPYSILHSTRAIRNSVLLHAGACGDCFLSMHLASAVRSPWPGTRTAGVYRCPLAAFAVGPGPIDAAINPDRVGLGYFSGDGEPPAEAPQW